MICNSQNLGQTERDTGKRGMRGVNPSLRGEILRAGKIVHKELGNHTGSLRKKAGTEKRKGTTAT